MIVMKFGGSSVKTAIAMRSAAEIVISQSSRQPLVILSACGGITDKLLHACECAARAHVDDLRVVITEIRRHHVQLCQDLLADTPFYPALLEAVELLLSELSDYCEGMALLCECTPQSQDAVASFGERLSTTIFAALLNASALPTALHDARSTMVTDRQFTRAQADQSQLSYKASQLLAPLFLSHSCVVSQGFIGATSDGIGTTLGRGGSDLSAALIGAALKAEEIQIWTDVSGVLSADPRIVEQTKSIAAISFSEMRQLAYFGAKVLHPDTIKPAVDTSIPVRILNTFQPDHPGTTVVADDHASARDHDGLRALSLLRNCALVRLDVGMHEHATQVLAETLLTARQHNTEVLLCFAEEASLGIVIRKADMHLLEGHGRRIEVCDVLCACGPHLSHSNSIGKVNSALQPFHALAILSGLSDVGVLALLDPAVSLQALQTLHADLVS